MLLYSDHINFLILPTDSCNLNCVYCFHKPHSKSFDKISIDTIKHLLDISSPYYKNINFIWHGGEPLLMGMDFYKEVLELQQNYNNKICNSMQSNLTLLTPEFADFLSENNFTISGSFDGTCNEQSRGHSQAILNGRSLMIERGKRCGLVMVLSGLNIDHLIESYNFFKIQNINFTLNIYLDSTNSNPSPLKLEETHTIEKMCELFDYWAKDTSGNIHISYFKNILDYIVCGKKSLCSYTSCLGRWFGLRYDGSLTPCNRYFPQEYCFGNIHDYDSIGEAFESEGFKKLLTEAVERRNNCKECPVYNFCAGGCNNVALNENGVRNNGGLSCKVLIGVYKHIEVFLSTMDRESSEYNPLLIQMTKKL